MEIKLNPELEKWVEERIATGEYDSISEVVETALYQFWEQKEMTVEELVELRREIQIGIDQADRGELIPMEEVFDSLRERHRMRIAKQQ